MPTIAENVDRVSFPKGVVESTTREELIADFANGFKGAAKGTRAKTMKVRPVLLSPTAGLVDHTYTMYNADGSEVGAGHTTFVALKNAGVWKVVAVRYASAWPAGQEAGARRLRDESCTQRALADRRPAYAGCAGHSPGVTKPDGLRLCCGG